MSSLSAFHGPNAGYVLDLYDRYLQDPSSVDPDTRATFEHVDPDEIEVLAAARPSSGAPPVATSAPTGPIYDVSAVVGAAALAQAIRDYGHLDIQLDPLGTPPHGAPELHPTFYGLTDAQLATLPVEAVPWPASPDATNAKEAIDALRRIYSGGVGYDFDQVQIAEERAWLREAVESGQYTANLSPETKKALLERLTEVEAFERFLHQTYLGQKRFSIEGTDSLVPMLDTIIRDAALGGVREVVLGMAHRGRLNVLTHILGKPYAAIIAAFEGSMARSTAPSESSSDDGVTGDVKYHLGARRAETGDGETIEVPLVLAPNPSHLEFVNPVVEGMARASQDQRSQPGAPPHDRNRAMAILLHGDAAFPGQGIVAETLNFSGLPGYSTGGTIHVIVNNQIGFTTDIRDSRTTLYAGDLAKGFEIPVVHVNADDPASCICAARLATAYRQRFGKDFLIDLVGYRRWGHNEGDEPAFTQPRMYATVTQHPTVRQRFAESLIAEGTVTAEEATGMLQATLDELATTRKQVVDSGSTPAPFAENGKHDLTATVDTSVPADQLRAYDTAIHALPEGMQLSPKLRRQWERRAAVLTEAGGEGKLDWAHAETLAFASILADGTPIRLTGQDSERGTFSQRHLVLHDATTGKRWIPLQTLPEAKASFAVYNSPLSENAAVGFEYGYTVHAPEALVLWEAQFGDFVNGAQVIIDQFLVAARAKWQQEPALVLLLPHGYEGQGPEHSSARLERFLQLFAEGNLVVANPTTSAQYFHLLRRQAKSLTSDRRPLVVMTPKSLLRNPAAASTLDQFAEGTFQPVLDDPRLAESSEAVTRLVLCSGKLAVELDSAPQRLDVTDVAVARIEQLAPFPAEEITRVIARYPNLREIVWAQEEPRNMGAWTYVDPRLRELLQEQLHVSGIERPLPLRYAGRPERASPAEGSLDRHGVEQARIIQSALVDAPATSVAANGGGRGAKTNGAARNGARTKATRASAGQR
ncbi:MAG: 2-oxoglutarate dehydrogenase E1 component [Chloroflexi bacterium]|nr:2-oxoglutarate dehydrogenase E1 component [Chloroflexota bacterium]